MDKDTAVKEDSSERARELLIAISESEPDKIEDSTPVQEKSEKPKETNEDRLREELISISDSPSPDKIELPAIPGV